MQGRLQRSDIRSAHRQRHTVSQRQRRVGRFHHRVQMDQVASVTARKGRLWQQLLQLLCGESEADVNTVDDVLSLEEAGCLTVRGTSEILRVPLMITFYNQTDLVKVSVGCVTEEFSEADYKKFNLSMCQFMDSAEIAMHS